MSNSIQKIFSEVPKTYEVTNHALTLGLDIVWRRRAARAVVDRIKGGQVRLLEVCTGTGETAIYLQRWASEGTEVLAADFTAAMLAAARRKKDAAGIRFFLADARALPFGEQTFDAVCTSFATRNLNTSRDNLKACFGEFRRVLKPGGVFTALETSQPCSALVRRLLHGFVAAFVRPVGSRMSGSKAAYAYLSTTIPRFYDAYTLAAILREAGFENVAYRPLFLGVAAMHQATR